MFTFLLILGEKGCFGIESNHEMQEKEVLILILLAALQYLSECAHHYTK